MKTTLSILTALTWIDMRGVVACKKYGNNYMWMGKIAGALKGA
jgi:hypothetical protein